MRIHSTMSKRVSSHFKVDVKVGYDEEHKMFCVINHNGNPVVWFHAFNALAIKGIKDHLELRFHKHNMPKPEKAVESTMREKRRIAGNYFDETEEMRRVGSRHSVVV